MHTHVRALACGARTAPLPALAHDHASPSTGVGAAVAWSHADWCTPAFAADEAAAGRCDAVVCLRPSATFDELAERRRRGALAAPLIAATRAPDAAAARSAIVAGADDAAPADDPTALAAAILRAVRAAAHPPTHAEHLLQSVPCIVWEADPETLQFTFVSRHAEALFGYPVAEWLERDFWERHLHPDDRAIALRHCQASRDGRDHEFDFRMVAHDGSAVWLRKIVRVVRTEGRPTVLRGVMLEISERVQAAAELRSAQERLHSALRVGSIGTFVVDFAAGTTVWDAALEEIYGRRWDPADGADRTAFLRHVHPDDRERVAADLGVDLEAGTCRRAEYRYVRGDGRTIQVVGTVSIELDAAGRPARLLGAAVDVTPMRSTQALRDAQNEVLEMIAADAPLPATLDRLLRGIEAQEPRMRTSILLLDDDGLHLRCAAAPSMPRSYFTAVDGLCIGPTSGSCGAGAFFRKPIVVVDTATDPLFADFQDICRALTLRSSWSLPILDSHGNVLGTFAAYGDGPGAPAPSQLALLDSAVDTAAICIDRHRSAAAMRSTVQRLDLALAAAHMGVFEWCLDRNRIWWSPECRQALGTAAEPAPTPDAWDRLVHRDDRDPVRAAFDAVIRDGTDCRCEFRVADATPAPRWIECQCRVAIDPESGRRRLIGTLHDITASRTAADALRASEERLQLAMRGSTDGIWDWDVQTNAAYLSPRWKAMLGYAEHELPDHLDSWRRLAHPDDVERTLAFAADFAQGRTDKYEIEFRMRHRDGRWLDILSRAFLVRDDAGRPWRLVGTHVDMTARKRAEQALRDSETRFRMLVETAIDAVITVDEAGTVVHWNREAEAMFGWSRDEAVGSALVDLVIPTHARAPVAAAIRQQSLGDADVLGRRTERTALRRDGSEFPVELAVSTSRGPDGRPQFHAFVRDITQRRRADEVKASLEAQLRQAQKLEAIGTLAGGIAHDFNNILAAILGSVELLLLDAPPGSVVHDRSRAIHDAARRGADLVRQILTFSRSRPPLRQPMNLPGVVRDVHAMLRATLPARVNLTTAIDESCPPVLADATQIQQVLMNLYTNSWHALRSGTGSIAIELGPHVLTAPQPVGVLALPPGTYVRLAVSDDGTGIPAAVRHRIFEPFFTTKPPDEGTGLGLAVVHGIVAAHDGVIEVDSREGEGTRMTIYLPAVGTEPTVVLPAIQTLQRGNGRRVLYLDDEEVLVELAARFLARLDYRATTFASAAKALAAFRAAPDAFDAVVTDYSMPTMSGIEFAEAIRAIRADIPVLLSSGRVTPDVLDDARRAGVRHFLPKPNSVLELAKALAAAFDPSGGVAADTAAG